VEEFFALGIGNACVCQGLRGLPLNMSRLHPECFDPETGDGSVAGDGLVAGDSEEDDEEEEDDKDEEDEDEDEDGGYSQ